MIIMGFQDKFINLQSRDGEEWWLSNKCLSTAAVLLSTHSITAKHIIKELNFVKFQSPVLSLSLLIFVITSFSEMNGHINPSDRGNWWGG